MVLNPKLVPTSPNSALETAISTKWILISSGPSSDLWTEALTYKFPLFY